jgi:drug/metabolite transporter (DMT)-like permease
MRFGIYALVVAVFSTLFHASHTYAFETADLASMLFLGTELVVRNLMRLGWLRNASPVPFAGLLFLGGLGLLFGTEGIDRLSVFGAFAVLAAFFEAVLFVRARRRTGGAVDPALRATYRPYLLTLALFLVAWACWIIDYRRIICDPDQHFLSGHALWHLLNSGCFLTLSWFYERVSGLAPVRPAR